MYVHVCFCLIVSDFNNIYLISFINLMQKILKKIISCNFILKILLQINMLKAFLNIYIYMYR